MGKLYPEEFYNSVDYFIDRHIREGRGDKVCAITDQGNFTYGQMQKMTNKMANLFRKLEIKVGERIIMLVLDSPWFFSTFWGAVRMGAVPVPSNTMLTSDDYEYYLNDSQAVALVISERLLPVIKAIEGELPFLRDILVVSDNGEFQPPYSQIYAAAAEEAETVFATKDDIAFWLYTSGTTGGPKGAVHSQSDMQYCADTYGKHILNLQENDIVYSAARLFFAYGIGNGMFYPLSIGGASILNPDPPTPAHAFRLISQYKATLFFGIPTLFGQMLEYKAKQDKESGAAPDPKVHELATVRACPSAGEALPPDLYTKFRERFGVEILDGPGSTEMLHIYVSNRIGDVKPGSSGKPVPGYEAKVVDDEGQELPVGEIGTLWAKGGSSLRYYWRKREKTANTIIGQWINTGDKYYKDAEGYFWPSGRADDMLKVGGIWVSPLEVENCLREHEAVLECAVIGAEDDKNLVKPKAFIVLKQGVAPSGDLEKELKQWVLDRLAKFKYPRWIVFMDELPKTATGKIQRFKLR